MEFELTSLPGLGHHNDRGFGVFACPHPRFRELDFCRPKSGSSTVTIKDVDRHIDDLTRPSKSSKKSKEKKVDTVEETALKEVTRIDTTVKDEENKLKEDVEDEMEEDISALEIFKEVEKPTFEASHDGLEDEAEEDLKESGTVAEVEKLGPKSSYTPQTGGELSEVKSTEVGATFS